MLLKRRFHVWKIEKLPPTINVPQKGVKVENNLQTMLLILL